jgi:excisionase family DNA binding protein
METTTKARVRRASSSAQEPIFSRPIIADGIERPVTSSELAQHLQITTRTLATWRLSGRIPYWRCSGRSYRYRISTVEKALENLR